MDIVDQLSLFIGWYGKRDINGEKGVQFSQKD